MLMFNFSTTKVVDTWQEKSQKLTSIFILIGCDQEKKCAAQTIASRPASRCQNSLPVRRAPTFTRVESGKLVGLSEEEQQLVSCGEEAAEPSGPGWKSAPSQAAAAAAASAPRELAGPPRQPPRVPRNRHFAGVSKEPRALSVGRREFCR